MSLFVGLSIQLEYSATYCPLDIIVHDRVN